VASYPRQQATRLGALGERNRLFLPPSGKEEEPKMEEVWSTTPTTPFRWSHIGDTIKTTLGITKPPTSRACGFGTQTGEEFYKDGKRITCFGYDNMRGEQVWRGKEEEPLYHAEPHMLLVNTNPGK